jgi:endonuclease/exonuclease/phosphatase family metal-dependent hydrolase
MTDIAVRIASYNIHKARGLDRKHSPERILQVINQLDADIVVLQEADKRLGPRKPAIGPELIELETDFQLVDVSANGISIGWHGNAVLIRKGARVLRSARLDLPGLEPRGAVRVDLDVGAGVSVVATHLGLRRRDRRAQLAVLRDATQDAAHTVIAGDFNEWSRDKGLEPLAERFETCAPGRSFHARRPMAALDRFALSRGIALHDAGVEQGALASRASDHLPIWSDIEVPGPLAGGTRMRDAAIC